MPDRDVSAGLSESDAAALAAHALAYIRPGQVIGLGTGQAATAFVHALGRQVQAGLSVTAVSPSGATATLARELGIPPVSLAGRPAIDATLDAAGEAVAAPILAMG